MTHTLKTIIQVSTSKRASLTVLLRYPAGTIALHITSAPPKYQSFVRPYKSTFAVSLHDILCKMFWFKQYQIIQHIIMQEQQRFLLTEDGPIQGLVLQKDLLHPEFKELAHITENIEDIFQNNFGEICKPQ